MVFVGHLRSGDGDAGGLVGKVHPWCDWRAQWCGPPHSRTFDPGTGRIVWYTVCGLYRFCGTPRTNGVENIHLPVTSRARKRTQRKMDSWDDDEFEVPSLAENQPKVAANWDDSEEEEEEEQTPQVGASGESAPKGPLKPKQLKKLKLKELEEKRAMEVALTKARLAQQANETDEQRKAREKASMEEADLEAALDAFAPAAKKTEATDDVEAALNGMRLISLADHEKFGEAVSKRLLTSNARYALEAMKVIVTRGSVNLTADDMKDLTTIINVIKNEKIAAAKPKGKKKKQTGRQGYANVERDNDGFDDLSGGAGAGRGYDDYDDFM